MVNLLNVIIIKIYLKVMVNTLVKKCVFIRKVLAHLGAF